MNLTWLLCRKERVMWPWRLNWSSCCRCRNKWAANLTTTLCECIINLPGTVSWTLGPQAGEEHLPNVRCSSEQLCRGEGGTYCGSCQSQTPHEAGQSLLLPCLITLGYYNIAVLSLVKVESPEGEGARSKWKQFFTRRKRKAVLACFLAVPYFDISKWAVN